MIVHNWGEVAYTKARQQMQKVHEHAQKDGDNHLILCSHPDVFTIGADEKKEFGVATLRTDRGGSITCHSKGQNVYYFCFQVRNPANFYKKVLTAFEHFFAAVLPEVHYEKQNPGFYIQNRKIASLGFRYAQGVSLHGVSLNVAVDLEFHAHVSPCNLEGITATSLENEGVVLTQKEVDIMIVDAIQESFDERL